MTPSPAERQDEPVRMDAKTGLVRVALMLLSTVIILEMVNFLARQRPIWYCTPVVNPHLLKLYALATDPRRYDIIVLGSSVAERAFVPQVIEEELNARAPQTPGWQVYNASVPGSLFPMYRDVVRDLVGRSQRPRLIMLAVGARDCNGAEARMAEQIRYYTKTPGDFLLALREAPGLKQKGAALYSRVHGLEALLQWPVCAMDPSRVAFFQYNHGGFLAYPLTAEALEINRLLLPPAGYDRDQLRQKKLRGAREEQLADFRINPMVRRLLAGTIQGAREKGVTLIIVFTPESAWFLEHAYRGERTEARDFIRETCQREDVPFFDLGAPPFRPDDNHYFDGSDHLGMEGSIQLSRAVSREIILPSLVAGASAPEK
jgi:hypothetical protein